MHRLVIDTNVIVLYCISLLGYFCKIFQQIVLSSKALLILSNEIMEEYAEVLSRTRFSLKFPHFREVAENTFTNISLFGEYVFPTERIRVLKDQSDNKFLEAAFEGDADFLITGNSNDFSISEYRGTRILSPQQFWTLIGMNL